MSKIRTKEDLQTRLDNDFTWRRSEIYRLKELLRSNRDVILENALIRSLILVSYSHWEGFVKKSCIYYITYVRQFGYGKDDISQKLALAFLANNLYNKSTPEKLEMLTHFFETPDYKLNISISNLIDTKSNLKSDVLQELLQNIGASTDTFDTKFHFIDYELLGNRNPFAHGERVNKLSKESAIDIAETVITLIAEFKTLIENLVHTDSFKRV